MMLDEEGRSGEFGKMKMVNEENRGGVELGRRRRWKTNEARKLD